jgi:hypothetical protein
LKLKDFGNAIYKLNPSELLPYCFERILFARTVKAGESSLSVFPQSINDEDRVSINSSGLKIIALGIGCRPTFQLNRQQYSFREEGNVCVVSSWPSFGDKVVLRTSLRQQGFLVFLLVKAIDQEMRLKRMYQLSDSEAKTHFPKSASSLGEFFQIPCFTECAESLENLSAELIQNDASGNVKIDGDEEIVSFLCGKEGKRVVHPVRTRKCAHIQCFELDVLPPISNHLDGKGGI